MTSCRAPGGLRSMLIAVLLLCGLLSGTTPALAQTVDRVDPSTTTSADAADAVGQQADLTAVAAVDPAADRQVDLKRATGPVLGPDPAPALRQRATAAQTNAPPGTEMIGGHRATEVGDKIRALGWGLTDPASVETPPRDLQEFDTKVVVPHRCASGAITKGDFCVDNPGGYKGTCYGDSGGPAAKKIDRR